MKKKAILLFLLIQILALLLSACGSSGTQAAAETEMETPETAAAVDEAEAAQPETAAQQNDTAAGTGPTGAPLDFTERGDSSSGEYADASGNRYTYSYSLPLVSGDTDYAASVNKELDEIYETYIAPELRHMDAGNSLVTTYTSWRTAEYKGITSLLVCLYNSWDESNYFIWHFTVDGEPVTNAELLDALGLSGDAFTAAVTERLTAHLGPSKTDYKSEEIRAAMEAYREKTLTPENCSAELPIYVTPYGTVCFVGRVYTPAGAGYYDHLFILAPEEGFTDGELAELARDLYGIEFRHQPGSAAIEANEDWTVTISL